MHIIWPYGRKAILNRKVFLSSLYIYIYYILQNVSVFVVVRAGLAAYITKGPSEHPTSTSSPNFIHDLIASTIRHSFIVGTRKFSKRVLLSRKQVHLAPNGKREIIFSKFFPCWCVICHVGYVKIPWRVNQYEASAFVW